LTRPDTGERDAIVNIETLNTEIIKRFFSFSKFEKKTPKLKFLEIFLKNENETNFFFLE